MITDTKSILLDLITEDFCHQQFLQAMEQTGFISNNIHDPELVKPIAALLGISSVSDAWLDTYCAYYEKACLLAYQDKAALRVLAERCLGELVVI